MTTQSRRSVLASIAGGAAVTLAGCTAGVDWRPYRSGDELEGVKEIMTDSNGDWLKILTENPPTPLQRVVVTVDGSARAMLEPTEDIKFRLTDLPLEVGGVDEDHETLWSFEVENK